MRPWIYLVCSALVLGSIATVEAADNADPYPRCDNKPTEADQKAAKSLFTAGQVAFNEADYQTAIRYWRDSYKRDCTAHLLLHNLARAYELNGEKREAVLALKTYLSRQANIPTGDREQTQRRIENLEAQLASLPQPVPRPDSSPTVAQPNHPEPTAAANPAPTVAPVAPVASGTPATTSASRPITPWIVVGAGGVLTIVGGVLWLDGNSKVSDAEKVCPNRQCPSVKGQLTAEGAAAKDKGDSGRSELQLGGIMAGVGLVGVAGGLVWQFVFNKPKQQTNTAAVTDLGPSFGSGYSGLTLKGQF